MAAQRPSVLAEVVAPEKSLLPPDINLIEPDASSSPSPESGSLSSSDKTFRVTRATLRTLSLAIILCALLLGALEIAARLGAFGFLPFPPSVGSSTMFDVKMQNYRDYVRENGVPDCILTGDSTAMAGMDPSAFSAAYEAETGQPIRCFNLAISATSPTQYGLLVPLLLKDAMPKLIIAGVNYNDFVEDHLTNHMQTDLLINIPWAQHKLGNPSIRGWLLDSSFLYRYWVGSDNYLRDSQRHAEVVKLWGNFTEDGRWVTRSTEETVILDGDMNIVTYNPEFIAQPELIAGLDNITALQEQQVTVIFVEEPYAPVYWSKLNSTGPRYYQLTSEMQKYAESRGVRYISSMPSHLIPTNGWLNATHLSYIGAEIYSNWLGAEIAKWYDISASNIQVD